MEQKLKSLIDAKSLPMGVTDEGRAWCLKALHPSDPTATVDGIPDESAIPSVHLGYQTTQTIYAPTGSAGNWGCDLSLLPHPVVFSSFYGYDATSAHVYRGTHTNTQLAGSTHLAKMTSFLQTAQRWRLAYMSATVYQDAAALTNQGSVAACQYVAEPTIASLDQGVEGGPGLEPPNPAIPECIRLVMSWRRQDQPSFETAQNMPNAYFGNSRDGVYMPLKLTRTCQKWRSEANCFINGGIVGVTEDGNVSSGVQTTGGGGYACLPQTYPPIVADTIPDAGWPFWGGDGWIEPLMTVDYGESGKACYPPHITAEMCNDVLGSICFKNLDITTRLSIVYRVGFEVQVQPGTSLTPLQKLSPRHDETALHSYFAIAREMKDAHPADFNDLGKIWDVISSVGKTVLPMVSPFMGPMAPLAGVGLAMGDRIKRGLETGRNPPSLADREIAARALKKATAPRPRAKSTPRRS